MKLLSLPQNMILLDSLKLKPTIQIVFRFQVVRSFSIMSGLKDTVLRHVKIKNTSCKYPLNFTLSKCFGKINEDVFFGSSTYILRAVGMHLLIVSQMLRVNSFLYTIIKKNVCLMD